MSPRTTATVETLALVAFFAAVVALGFWGTREMLIAVGIIWFIVVLCLFWRSSYMLAKHKHDFKQKQ